MGDGIHPELSCSPPNLAISVSGPIDGSYKVVLQPFFCFLSDQDESKLLQHPVHSFSPFVKGRRDIEMSAHIQNFICVISGKLLEGNHIWAKCHKFMQIYKTFSIFRERLLVRNEKVKSSGFPTCCKTKIIFSVLKTKKPTRSKNSVTSHP